MKKKRKLLTELKTKWEMLQKQYIAESKKKDANIKKFLFFVGYNLRIMSVGGINLGRSEISNFIDEKSTELNPFFDRFLP